MTSRWSVRRILRAIDFFINDLLVVGFSISDIILDVLVCMQFYRQGRTIFFYISVLIFIFAQLSYAFLFVATWGKKLRSCGKILLFFLVLPLGQLVPFFTWIEAFRFPRLDAFIRKIGMHSLNIFCISIPTSCAVHAIIYRPRADARPHRRGSR
jgi:hypothetical protein